MFDEKKILHTAQEAFVSGRNIRLRPTRLCLSLLVLSAAVWVGAVNYQVNVVYAVCFWLIGFVGVAALMTRRQLAGLCVRLDYDGEVFAGETARVRLSISHPNPQVLLWWRSVQQNLRDAVGNSSEHWQRYVADKGAGGLVWEVHTVRRGYFPRPLRLCFATSAPFGLFHADCRIEWQTEAVVYPCPLPHDDSGSRIVADTETSARQTEHNGDDIAFLKEHQAGVSLQHIAWKAYAKRGELMDKVFDAPPPAAYNETISYRDYPAGTPADKLAGLLAYRVLEAERLGLHYTLQLYQTTISPQNGQRRKCLNALALM